MLFTSRNHPRCPRCKSDRVYFSSPKPGDFFFKLILQVPVRCQACYTRFGTWFKAKKLSEPTKATSDSMKTSGIRSAPHLDGDKAGG